MSRAARGGALPLEPTRRAIEHRRGRAQAIGLRDLIVVVGVRSSDPSRVVRAAIAELVAAGVPIGSLSREGSSGYFLVTDESELTACVAELMGRARELEKRAEQLVEAFRRGPRQPRLFDAEMPGVASGASRPREGQRFVPPVRQFIDERLSRTTSPTPAPAGQRP